MFAQFLVEGPKNASNNHNNCIAYLSSLVLSYFTSTSPGLKKIRSAKITPSTASEKLKVP